MYLAYRCYASIHNLTKPKQGSPFTDLFSFAMLASIVHTISFAGFTGTNGSICFHQVSYLKQFFLSSLSRLLGKFSVKKKPVPRNKFTIKPSFYIRSNSEIDNNNKNDINIYVNPLTAVGALRTLMDFILSNARRFYSSMGNPCQSTG